MTPSRTTTASALALVLAAVAGPMAAQDDPVSVEELADDVMTTLQTTPAPADPVEAPADPATMTPSDPSASVTTTPLEGTGGAVAAEDAEALPETDVVLTPAPLEPAAEPEVEPVPEVAAAPAPAVNLTPEAIEAATFDAGGLPDGPAPITVKTQILLDRAGISPGIIDGRRGGMSTSALAAFESREGLPADGELDADVWSLLGGDTTGPVLTSYTLTEEDFADLAQNLPGDYAELAELDWLGYQSVTEKVAERFHMGEGFLKELNPGASFTAGETLTVADPGPNLQANIGWIEVRKAERRLVALDENGRIITSYPVTIGSTDLPSPSGVVAVNAVARNPTYHYNPSNFVQGENLEPLTLPPGPNGPVGSMWIDLSEPSYGLHGTPRPETLFSAASHGCVRLTNWDAWELAELVEEGLIVRFVD